MIPLDSSTLAYFLGIFSSTCFAFQYIPQAVLNFRRKSVKGFNTTGIIIKLVGACFLAVNAILTREPFPVILYGLVNVAQHSVFMIQFALYEHNPKYYRWLAFPLLPLLLGILLPESIRYTNLVKPVSQVLSHFPQLWECYRSHTTLGVSMLTQHLNFSGGLTGLYMCLLLPPKAFTTYIIYGNSVFQAVSLYAMAIAYGEFGPCARPPSSGGSSISPSTAISV